MVSQMSEVCTICGKPALFVWNRFGDRIGACSYEHGWELVEYPRDNFNYNNGKTDYSNVKPDLPVMDVR